MKKRPGTPLLIPRRRLLAAGAAVPVVGLGGCADAAEPPRLDLDFTGPQLPPGVRFRRDGAAWYEAAPGRFETAGPNAPRWVRDAQGDRTGMLIEAGSTNHVRQSARLGPPAWEAKGSASIAAAPDVPAPDGSRRAARLRVRKEGDDTGIFGSAGRIARGERCVFSVWLRGAGPPVQWVINVYDYGTFHGEPRRFWLTDKWQRVTVPVLWDMADDQAKMINLAAAVPEDPPGALREAFAWGAQFEDGRVATSLITTEGTPASRGGEAVTFPAVPFDTLEGQLRVRLPQGGTREGVILDTTNGDESGIRLGYNTSGWLAARVGDVTLAGDADATADTEVVLSWGPSGVLLESGGRHAAVRQAPRTVTCGAEARLGARMDGSDPLDRPVARLTLSPPAFGQQAAVARVAAAGVAGFVPAGYELTFGDDFDDGDTSRINEDAEGGGPGAPAWRSRYRHDRFVVINQEKQLYLDRDFAGKADLPLGIDPFEMKNGVLTILATRIPEDKRRYLLNFAYASGAITSELTFWQTYGYFEMRARLPLGKGFWPAFWLLPKRVAWPPEIDVFEGSGARPNAVHVGVIESRRKSATKWISDVISIADGFHVYGLEWTRERIVWFLDGKPVFQQPNSIHEDMYILANLAVGSHDPKFIPNPDGSTPFPGRFEIDYIRAYRRVD